MPERSVAADSHVPYAAAAPTEFEWSSTMEAPALLRHASFGLWNPDPWRIRRRTRRSGITDWSRLRRSPWGRAVCRVRIRRSCSCNRARKAGRNS